MPRTAPMEAGLVYHVLNRGNGPMRLFHKDEDFAAVLAPPTDEAFGRALDPTRCAIRRHSHDPEVPELESAEDGS